MLSPSSSISSTLATCPVSHSGSDGMVTRVSPVTPLVACTTCHTPFSTEKEQRDHYKSTDHVRLLKERYGHLWANPWPIKAGKSGKERIAAQCLDDQQADLYRKIAIEQYYEAPK